MAELKRVHVRKSVANGQTTLLKSGSATNTTTTVYTVPVGKVFFLTGAFLNLSATANAASIKMIIGSTDVLIIVSTITAGQWDRDRFNANLITATPLPFPAGTLFKVQSDNASATGNLLFNGWEEDV